jgi:hypothetical protein
MSKTGSGDSSSPKRETSSDGVERMLDALAESGEADRMDGIDFERLKAAMSAPGAAETIAEVQSMGANAQASVGQIAPDFELPWLSGQRGADAERVRLSQRFVNRPVALVFGSYT